ncbi:carbohydrate kinase family protein [Candidatus Woesearchaeota archaeon]|nr:carbohydrate kinase family protein [Candidatus Woesearchaeota archaeon]
MPDLISIGDVTEDVFIQVDELSVLCPHGKQSCLLCMRFAEKIAASRVDKLTGGNAGNVAIGCNRLGLHSALFSVVGDDEQGRLIRQSLKKERVSTAYFSLKKGERTNYSVVINYQAERTILVHHEPRKYPRFHLAPCRMLYFTSMGTGSEKLHRPLLSYAKKHHPFFAFNPGTHQLKSGLRKLKPLLQASDAVFLNTEEAQLLLSTQKIDFPFLLRKLKASGTKIAVITDGPAGSYAYDGRTFWYCPIYDVPIVERTGCGDSYASGFLAALFYGHDIPEAMRWGTLNAASVIQQIGPQAGLMKLSKLRKILRANTGFTARMTHQARESKTKYRPRKFRKL